MRYAYMLCGTVAGQITKLNWHDGVGRGWRNGVEGSGGSGGALASFWAQLLDELRCKRGRCLSKEAYGVSIGDTSAFAMPSHLDDKGAV